MNYNNDMVRRQDRLLDEERAMRLLRDGEWATMAMYDTARREPYAIPVSYAWDGENSLYIHCAPHGRKLDVIASCRMVSVVVVGQTNVLSDKFTTEYDSLVLECEAQMGLDENERMKALELMLDKYSPADKVTGMKYAQASFSRTEIIRLDIGNWSGKSKSMGMGRPK